MECEAWSVECGAWSVKREAWGVERGAWSVKRGAWSGERFHRMENLRLLTFDLRLKNKTITKKK